MRYPPQLRNFLLNDSDHFMYLATEQNIYVPCISLLSSCIICVTITQKWNLFFFLEEYTAVFPQWYKVEKIKAILGLLCMLKTSIHSLIKHFLFLSIYLMPLSGGSFTKELKRQEQRHSSSYNSCSLCLATESILSVNKYFLLYSLHPPSVSLLFCSLLLYFGLLIIIIS